jgi:hypothetical protein
MGTIGDCFDNSMVESFFGTLQLELLYRQAWPTRQELANAIFEYIEAWYNPYRRHSTIGMLSPVQFEQSTHRRHRCGVRAHRNRPGSRGKLIVATERSREHGQHVS